MNPSPAAPTFTGTTTICAGSSTTITASGVGGATFAWYDAATGGTLLDSDNVLGPVSPASTTTYYVQQTSAGCTSTRTAVTVTVNPIPAAPTVSGTTSICSGNTTTLTASGAVGATFGWYDAPAAGTLLASTAAYTTPALAATTTYYVQQTVSGCTSARTAVTVTVSGAVTPTVTISASPGSTVCAGTSVTFSAVVTGGGTPTYQWLLGGAPIAGATSSTYVSSTLVTGNAISLQVTSSLACASPSSVTSTTVTMTVNPIPSAPTFSGTTTICSGSTTTLTAGGAGGATFDWYDAATGGTLLASTAAYTTPALAASTTYYVQQTVSGCTSTRTAVAVTVNPVPAAPTASGTTICAGAGASLTATGAGGATFDWYTASTGGTLLSTGATYSPSPATTTTYYVQQTVSGCASARTAVTVTVTPAPTAPTITGTTICSGTSASLTAGGLAGGSTVQWYSASTGGTLLFTGNPYSVTPAATTTYYVQQSVSGCASTRTAVTVTVNPTPSVSFSGLPFTACTSDAAVTMTGSPAGGTFSGTGVTGSSFNPAALAAGTYTITYSYTTGGCTGTATQNVIVSTAPCTGGGGGGGAVACNPATNVNAVATSTSTALVTWADSDTETGYEVWRGTVRIAVLSANVTSYTDTGLTPNTLYLYQIYPICGVQVAMNPAGDYARTFPAPPTAGAVRESCGPGTVTIEMPQADVFEYRWYEAETGGSPVAVTTGSFTTPVLTASKTYYVTVFSYGQESAPRTAVVALVNPDYAAQIVGAESGLIRSCGPTATLEAVEVPGASYLWKLNNISTGKTTRSIDAVASGKYSVVVTLGNCVRESAKVELKLNYKPFASIKEGPSPRFCDGGTLNAANVDAALEYSWSRGGTSIGTGTSVTASVSGDYTLTVTEPVSGCSATYTSKVSVVSLPTPITVSADRTDLCPGDRATLTATDVPGAKYQWQLGGKNVGNGASSISVGTAGEYRVVVSLNIPGGCFATSDVVTISVAEKPSVRFGSGADGLTATVTGSYTAIEWYRVNGPGLDDTALPEYGTDKTTILPEQGRYRVRLTFGNGCEMLSGTVYFSPVTGVEDEEGGDPAKSFLVYPNPTSGALNIRMESNGPARVTVADQLGRSVQAHAFESVSGGVSIDLSQLPAGVYTVTIVTDDATVTRKITKDKR